MNLVNMAMNYLGPVVAQQIASRLGIGGPIVNKLIAAALPAILGGVIGKSKTGGGIGSLMGMLTGPDRPQSNQLGTLFEQGGDIDAMTQSGQSTLEGLLGGQSMGALSSALGRHAGVDKAQAGSLLGMLAPAALGSIADQVAEQNMDEGMLAGFLDGQAANVAQAMPAQFATEMKGSGLFDGITSNLGAAATGLGTAATATAAAASTEAKRGMGMLPWIIGAALIALAAWFFLGRGTVPEVDTSAIPSAEELTVGGVNLGEQFGNVTGSLTDTFKGITDQASAEAALPQLEELSGQLGSIGDAAGQLSGTAKTGFQGIVSTALGTIKPMIEGVIASSGAGAILQPVVDQIFGALEGMAG